MHSLTIILCNLQVPFQSQPPQPQYCEDGGFAGCPPEEDQPQLDHTYESTSLHKETGRGQEGEGGRNGGGS